MHVHEVGDERRRQPVVVERGDRRARVAVVQRPHAVEEVRHDRSRRRRPRRARRRSDARVWPSATTTPRPRGLGVAGEAGVGFGRERDEPHERRVASTTWSSHSRSTGRSRSGRCAPGAPPRNGPSRWTPRIPPSRRDVSARARDAAVEHAGVARRAARSRRSGRTRRRRDAAKRDAGARTSRRRRSWRSRRRRRRCTGGRRSRREQRVAEVDALAWSVAVPDSRRRRSPSIAIQPGRRRPGWAHRRATRGRSSRRLALARQRDAQLDEPAERTGDSRRIDVRAGAAR